MDGKILFNLFAITLENILQKTLHRLIGRQSVTAKWFFVFGIRVINVWFRGRGIVAEFNMDDIVLETSSPTRLQ